MIFLSYSWNDVDCARTLERGLLGSGVSLWVDYRRITPDLPIEVQIHQAIEYSRGVVFLDSRRARASRWVRLEEGIAQHYRKPCIKWQTESGDIESIDHWLAKVHVWSGAG